jgi:di/tricarboxylate transporter
MADLAADLGADLLGAAMELKARLRDAREKVLPWTGMLAAGLGWALTDQLGSNLVFYKCGAAHPLLMIAIGLVGLAATFLGGLVSWRQREREQGGRHFVALIGAMMAVLFAVAIFLQTAASLFLPRCFG